MFLLVVVDRVQKDGEERGASLVVTHGTFLLYSCVDEKKMAWGMTLPVHYKQKSGDPALKAGK